MAIGAVADIRELLVVGYADALNPNMLPSIVPPVFGKRADRTRFILPPFRIDASEVRNGTEVDQEELADLQAAEEITLFAPGEVVDAQQGFELWIDQDFVHRYEPSAIVRTQLRVIAAKHVDLAVSALKEGRLVEAERFGGIAISANDRRIEPLVIRAVICRLEGNLAGEQLMVEMASSALTSEAFNALVERYQSTLKRPGQAHPAVFAACPTQGMAAVR